MTLHEYPEDGGLAESTGRVRYFASHGRPLVLGETFMLFCDRVTYEQFLTESSPWLAGSFSFFDGRAPGDVVVASINDLAYQQNLAAFLGLGRTLKGPR